MRHFTLIPVIFITIFMQFTIASGQDVANYTVHTVIKGDNVFRISLRYEVPMDSIRQWNNLDPLYLITVGQKLIVSGRNLKKAQNQVVDQVIAPKEIKDTVKIVESKLPEPIQEAVKQKPAPIATVKADTTDLSALLIKARELAYNKGRPESRKLCKLILLHDSTYYDASVLMGRTYLWDDKYDSARFVLNRVIHASPGYYDAMDALIDVELMSDNNEGAIKSAELALTYHKDDNGFLYKKAKALNKRWVSSLRYW
jgi:LysM repeat protein